MEAHLPKLIGDLALILIAGTLVTLLFRKIKQPLVLGYIIAGFLVSPHFKLFPTVADLENIKTLADIGVIFLLFGLGLEFSFKKLIRVGGSASITALVEIVFITIAGFFTGKLLGWSTMDCLFLGGMLASSSTTIIIRAFDELGLKSKNYAGVVFGVLVVEDIVVILLMVLLSTVAVTQHFEGLEMVYTIGKLLFFLILWFIMGIYLIPTFLKKIKNMMDDEGYLILSVGMCLGMVVIATWVGFSAELGAFIMGSILAETTSAEKIEHITKPIKEFFGAIFFVSVGMMIQPTVILEYGWVVLIITLLVVFGKIFSTTFGAVLSGQSLKQSIQVGMSMAQIGEFAFIVATLGMSLGVISDFLFPIAVGASAITTFTTPYLIKYSDKFYNLVEKVMPQKWLIAINNYSASTQTIQAESGWKHLSKRYTTIILSNFIITLAIMISSTKLLYPFISSLIDKHFLAGSVSFIITLIISLPFLWALIDKQPGNLVYKEIKENPDYSNGPLYAIKVIRILIALILLGYLVDRLFSTIASVVVIVPIIVVLLLLFSKRTKHLYAKFEDRFFSNLHSREEEKTKNTKSNVFKNEFSNHSNLTVWDVHLVDLELKQDMEHIGKSLGELGWRKKFGVNVVYIKRGDRLFYAPGNSNKLYPFDHIGVIATDDQLQNFMPEFKTIDKEYYENYHVEDIIIDKFVIDENSPLKNVSIKNSGIKELTDGLVIGIEHLNERSLNPSSNTIMQAGDIIWLVGERNKLEKLYENF